MARNEYRVDTYGEHSHPKVGTKNATSERFLKSENFQKLQKWKY